MWFHIWFCWFRSQERRLTLYIIGVLIARTYADYFLSNIIEFLTDILGMEQSLAVIVVNVREGLAGIFGIIGAILVDIYLTAYGMIFFSSMIYCIGFCFITVIHTIDKEDRRRRFIPISSHIVFALIGLCLTGVAQFSLKNSTTAWEKERIDNNESNRNSSLASMVKFAFGDDTEIFRYVQSHGYKIELFIVKYATKAMFVVVSTVVGIFTSVKIQRMSEDGTVTSSSYQTVAGAYYDTAVYFIPTIGLGLVTLMSLGYIKSFVKPDEHRGTPLKNVVRVFVATIRKRRLPCPQNNTNVVRLYEGDPENQMKPTDSHRFLEKAAIIESTEPEEERRKWKLCTRTEVEETKCLLRMAFMCMTFLAYGMVNSLGNTFFLLQGNKMNTTVKGIDVPLQTLTLIGEITGSGIQGLYALLISKKLTGSGKRYGPPVQYAIGLVLATFCCTVASWIAKEKSDENEDPNENDSVFWLTPQFILFGAMSGITRSGIEGFYHDQLPPSMKKYDSVFADAMIGAGATFSIGLVFGTFAVLSYRGAFYRAITVASFVILAFYTFIATRYRYHDTEETQPN